jgi:Subtilase family
MPTIALEFLLVDGSGYGRPASVMLEGTQGAIPASWINERNWYEAEVTPGDYRLSLVLDEMESPPPIGLSIRTLDEHFRIHLGHSGYSWKWMGNSCVAIDPSVSYFALASDRPIPSEMDVQGLLKEINATDDLLRPVKLPRPGPSPPYKLVFEAAPRINSERIAEALGKAIAGEVVSGTVTGQFQNLPLTLTVDPVARVADSFIALRTGDEHIVAFDSHQAALKFDDIAPKHQVHIIGPIAELSDTRLVRLPSSISDNAKSFLSGFNGYLYSESDLLDLQTLQQSLSIAPADCYAPHRIAEAWKCLATHICRKQEFGCPDIVVGLIDDQPIDPCDPRIVGASGTRLIFCAEIEQPRDSDPIVTSRMNDIRYSEEIRRSNYDRRDHAVRSYGVIAGSKVRGQTQGGIARGTTQLFVQFSMLRVSRLCEVLLWLSGLDKASWLPSLPKPADVICIEASSISRYPKTLGRVVETITTQGRGGRGTVVVCPAGNDSSGVAWLAAHPRVIGVACSIPARADSPETRRPDSNFGPGLNLCASADGIRTLQFRPLGKRGNSTAVFGATSAAAPMVAATAALMLCLNPLLESSQVTDILERTADVIDKENTSGPGKWFIRSGRFFSNWYGYGRLNARRALESAQAFKQSN